MASVYLILLGYSLNAKVSTSFSLNCTFSTIVGLACRWEWFSTVCLLLNASSYLKLQLRACI